MEWSRKRESGWNNLKGLWGWKIWTDKTKKLQKNSKQREQISRLLPFSILNRWFPSSFFDLISAVSISTSFEKMKDKKPSTHHPYKQPKTVSIYYYCIYDFISSYYSFLPQLFRLFYYSYITESFVSRYYVIYTSRQNKRISRTWTRSIIQKDKISSSIILYYTPPKSISQTKIWIYYNPYI
jgi:hypothetical protein